MTLFSSYSVACKCAIIILKWTRTKLMLATAAQYWSKLGQLTHKASGRSGWKMISDALNWKHILICSVFTSEIALRWMPKGTSLISQHWFRRWIGAIRQQAIIWANVDPQSLGHNKLRHIPLRFQGYNEIGTRQNCKEKIIQDLWTVSQINTKYILITTNWYLWLFFLMSHQSTYCSAKQLTHWGREKMAAFSQTTLSKAFSWMEILEFRLKFHWSLFLRVQLTIF